MATDALGEAIESYLRTGSYDLLGMPWPGNVIERSRRAHDALIQALVAEVMRRAKTRPAPDLAEASDGVAFVERTRDRAGRDALAREYGRDVHISEVRVDPAEVADILREAAPRRNGWKVILARCAPLTRSPARAGRTGVAEA